MADVLWQWDTKTCRYRNRATGRFLSADAVTALRDEFIVARTVETDRLVAELFAAAGSIGPESSAWPALVNELDRIGWRQVESTMIAEYAMGRGGAAAMTAAAHANLHALISRQKGYWDQFVGEMYAGEVKVEVGIRWRINLYHQAGRNMQTHALGAAWVVTLPTHPGEQACGPGCKCSWAITQRAGRIEATWRLGSAAKSCADCDRNSREYNPLVFEIEEEESDAPADPD